MSYYFRFEIPLMPDGLRVSYSPGWHGTMPKCPDKVTVLLYNDKECYGIAQTEDKFVPPEVRVIEESEALMEQVKAEDNIEQDGIWTGSKLEHRWDSKPLPFQIIPESLEAVTDGK